MTSNGMDIKLDQDKKGRHYLEYLVTGGVLDLYFLAGSGPIDVSKQYAALIGTPAMVPYWSLGVRSCHFVLFNMLTCQFHQCRFGYEYWFDVAEVVHNYSVAGIPLEYVSQLMLVVSANSSGPCGLISITWTAGKHSLWTKTGSPQTGCTTC